MKINLAVYTAQEGYSWQLGTDIPSADLKEYKTIIGKFPSADDPNLPFGGVFLKDDRVAFYRYHVAKKIDFLGRDALYCVLGVLPVAEASKVDIKTLFAKPQFAGPMQPFPTSVEVAESVDADVPEWLRNLDIMSLDVRITGTIEDMKCEVRQKLVKLPPPEPKEVPKADASDMPRQTHAQTELSRGSTKSEENQSLSVVEKTPVDRGHHDRCVSYADMLFTDKRKKAYGCRRMALSGVSIVAVATLALIGVSIVAVATLALIGAFLYGVFRVVRSARSGNGEKAKVVQSVEQK